MHFAVVALAAALFGAAEQARTPTSVARQEAESNVRTPAGRAYEGVVIARAEEWLRPALERCVKHAPAEERVAFEVFVRVGAGGKAEQVVFAPETEVARCVAPDFQSAKYPSPPQPSWWVKIEVRLK
ncbi:MAG: hypothetical protein M3R62_02930 [Acidobacteriota bacterium]|nr:hypothetical protein [Acidobacteriota bacterium]